MNAQNYAAAHAPTRASGSNWSRGSTPCARARARLINIAISSRPISGRSNRQPKILDFESHAARSYAENAADRTGQLVGSWRMSPDRSSRSGFDTRSDVYARRDPLSAGRRLMQKSATACEPCRRFATKTRASAREPTYRGDIGPSSARRRERQGAPLHVCGGDGRRHPRYLKPTSRSRRDRQRPRINCRSARAAIRRWSAERCGVHRAG